MIHLHRLLRFCWRVLKRFYQNKGLLLAGGVGYNGLLSVVPLFAVALVVASKVVNRQTLLDYVRAQLDVLLPGSSDTVGRAIISFIEEGAVVGYIGFGVCLLFGAIAFRVLEDAIAIIFQTRGRRRHHRSAAVSALISVAYVGVIALGLLLITAMMMILDAIPEHTVELLGFDVASPDGSTAMLKLVVFLGMVAVSTSFYRVLPVAQVRLRYALIGGTVAAALWELVRYTLMWYFANISLVGVIYGSLATVIVLLLSFEVGAIILLLGAQLISELERAAGAGLLWYEEPPRSELFSTLH